MNPEQELQKDSSHDTAENVHTIKRINKRRKRRSCSSSHCLMARKCLYNRRREETEAHISYIHYATCCYMNLTKLIHAISLLPEC